ncbi:uncharacterized protein SAPINGB_P005525 [Magnusiomyces paraingens]|uniref:Uncharacterized protein n=1 Tax=Magnusiomyces paraingens TaxID=2606893 RepID=A0A5E8C111_9ASCO|nr:uncharacterized protein SAPINGB_P005525 [Saprochaete ingens]VVT57082.1 unnamed protein product [Saprochaete ingens]
MFFTRATLNSFTQAIRASKMAAPKRSSSLVLAYIAFGTVAPFALPIKAAVSALDTIDAKFLLKFEYGSEVGGKCICRILGAYGIEKVFEKEDVMEPVVEDDFLNQSMDQ